MSRDIRAGGAFVEFFSKGKGGLLKDLLLVQGSLAAFASAAAAAAAAVAAVGGAITAGLGASFLKFSQMGDDLTDAANRIGITTERLQELTYAAGQSGAKMEDVERAMLQAQKKGLDFEKVAAAIGKIEDPMKRNQAAFAAFGKSGAKIAPMLKDLGALSAKARELGLVFKPEDVAAGGRMADMMGTIKAQVEAIVFAVGASMSPVMEQVFTVTQTILAEVIKMVRGIEDAIIAGNFALAFEIAWTGALLEFEKFRSQLLKNIATMGLEMLRTAAQIGKQFAKALLQGNFDAAELGKILTNPSRNARMLQNKLDRLIDKAAKQREEQGPLNMRSMPQFSVPKFGGGVGAQSGQFGTFSAAIAAMAGRTGTLSVQEKQLEALEAIEEDMAVIRKAAEGGGLVFT